MTKKGKKEMEPKRKRSIWLLNILWLPLLALALFVSFLSAQIFAPGNPLVSTVFAVFTVATTIVVVVSGIRTFVNAEDIEALLYQSGRLTLAERRKQARESREDMRDQTIKAQTRKNQVDAWSKIILVMIWIIGFTWVMNQTSHLYPAEVLLVPWWVLVIMWLVFIRFLPRIGVIILLVSFTALSLLMSTNPMMVVQLFTTMMYTPLFMVANFFMMFGPLAIINIMQIKTYKPGEGNWNVDLDDVRGQKDAVRQIIMAIAAFLSEDTSKAALARKSGVLLVGPPGTGKTLIAKAAATRLNVPFVSTTGSAFIATFMGIDVLVMLYALSRVNSLAKEFGGCVFFIDEAELLLRKRGGTGAEGEHGNQANLLGSTPFDHMQYDEFGQTWDLVFDNRESLAHAWEKKYPPQIREHKQMFPGMMGGMGMMNMAQPLLLSRMSGLGSVSMAERLIRSTINWLLDLVPFIPSGIGWRLPPAKAEKRNIMYMAATNMESMIDSAFVRPGRFELKVHFVLPGPAERADILDLYMTKANELEVLDPTLLNHERVEELAEATPGFSPAQLEQVIFDASSIQRIHVKRLQILVERVAGQGEDSLDPEELKFWKRFRHEMDTSGWDKIWATWESLRESLRTIRYGGSNPTRTNERNKFAVAHHEFMGHLVPLIAFLAKFMKATILSVMPRGQALGMVAHMQLEELDPNFQSYWEGLLRVMVGSVAAERVYFGENQPGVVSDLENATRTAAFMTGVWGMVPRKCSRDERRRYIRIGRTLLQVGGGMSMMGMMDPISKILQTKGNEVCLFLGQAFVDDYRLILKNRNEPFVRTVIDRLMDVDEIMGAELDQLWDQLRTNVKRLDHSDLTIWPDDILNPENPFYGETDGEEGVQ